MLGVAVPGALLVLLGERPPHLLDGHGVVASQGEAGVGEASLGELGGHGMSLRAAIGGYRVKVTWTVPLSATSVVTRWVSSSPRKSCHTR